MFMCWFLVGWLLGCRCFFELCWMNGFSVVGVGVDVVSLVLVCCVGLLDFWLVCWFWLKVCCGWYWLVFYIRYSCFWVFGIWLEFCVWWWNCYWFCWWMWYWFWLVGVVGYRFFLCFWNWCWNFIGWCGCSGFFCLRFWWWWFFLLVWWCCWLWFLVGRLMWWCGCLVFLCWLEVGWYIVLDFWLNFGWIVCI